MTRIVFYQLLILIIFACNLSAQSPQPTYQFKTDSINLFDKARNRLVPVMLYSPKTDKKFRNQKLVIFSHGYGENKGGDYQIYSYLTENLASLGYFVASIQHELSTDSLLAMKEPFKVTRKSNWERGVENIHFVLNELKIRFPYVDNRNLILIGHSNGGDMTALFATKYPELVDKIITLDNRRMPLPKTRQPKVYSIRSCDLPADDGVLPTAIDAKKYRIQIVALADTKHSDMDNDANTLQRREINSYLENFVRE
ncbi:serine aminopeptidase domain-containing protein [Dyadobacter sp. CY356]|uniref:alpha/beta hydrolase family protein n=1 Tax=Dyadobacter sp. CY356 TaxID=2906442 RepID=UPI001F2F4260|nr:alpha/beta hydrolase [Dyadobacter sp. CY356]MCF0056278.1 alpha/beta hydrolase [Dyadobacter sp. CY356]